MSSKNIINAAKDIIQNANNLIMIDTKNKEHAKYFLTNKEDLKKLKNNSKNILFFIYCDKLTSEEYLKRIKEIESYLQSFNNKMRCFIVFEESEIGKELMEKHDIIANGVGTVMFFNYDEYYKHLYGYHLNFDKEYYIIFGNNNFAFFVRNFLKEEGVDGQ